MIVFVVGSLEVFIVICSLACVHGWIDQSSFAGDKISFSENEIWFKIYVVIFFNNFSQSGVFVIHKW
jgi:hypothetical protein